MIKFIKKYFREKRMSKQLGIALGVLRGIDLAMKNQGVGRQKRREYWRQFINMNILYKEGHG